MVVDDVYEIDYDNDVDEKDDDGVCDLGEDILAVDIDDNVDLNDFVVEEDVDVKEVVTDVDDYDDVILIHVDGVVDEDDNNDGGGVDNDHSDINNDMFFLNCLSMNPN